MIYICVCVEHLKRCKTSCCLMMDDFRDSSFWIILAGGTWSMDRSGANEDTYPMLVISRLITVTYLPIFSEMGRGSTQEPPCRPFELFIVLHCCRNLALFYFILDFAASEPSSESLLRTEIHAGSTNFSWQFVRDLFCARMMHSTTKFAMLFLSKCVIPAVYVKLAGTLRGKPFQANNWQ